VVLLGAVILSIGGEYPRSIFDLVLGLNRWTLRVAAYAAVMTPQYPPFRLDEGEREPGDLFEAADASAPATGRPWGAGRVAGIVVASVVALVSLVAIAGGLAAVVFDQTQRDAAGYLMTPTRTYTTHTYALESASVSAGAPGDVAPLRELLGTGRIRVTSTAPVSAGIGRAAAVDSYLAGVARAQVTGFGARSSETRATGTHAAVGPPARLGMWAAHTIGRGT
jgi:hypothetical protein